MTKVARARSAGFGLARVVATGIQLGDARRLHVKADDLILLGEGQGEGQSDIAQADQADNFTR